MKIKLLEDLYYWNLVKLIIKFSQSKVYNFPEDESQSILRQGCGYNPEGVKII